MTLETSLKIAWRNIWRNRRRSVLTLLVVGFATGVIVFSNSLQLSSYDVAIDASLSLYHGHIQLQRDGYLERPQIRKSMFSIENLRNDFSKVLHVQATAARAEGFALITSEDRTYGAQVVGVEPGFDPLLSTISGVVREGHYLSANDSREVIVGALLAKNLHIRIGSEITILGSGRDGSLAADVLPVVGIFETGSSEIDRNMVQIPLHTFQDIYSMGDEIHVLAILLNRVKDVPQVMSELAKFVPTSQQLKLHSWEALLPGLKQSIDLDLSSGWILYILLILVVLFSITETFLMSVLERTKEFGIMLALGTSPISIAGLIVVECLMLAFLGVIVGVAFGSLVTLYFGYVGFSIPGSEEIMKLWNMPQEIHPRLSPAALTLSPAVVLVAAILASLYPVLKILWLKPISAMRGS